MSAVRHRAFRDGSRSAFARTSRMSDKQPPVNPFDPAPGAMRANRPSTRGPRRWWPRSTATNTPKPPGPILDSYLTASSPFREVLEKSMLRVLEQLSMPSRPDFIALAERDHPHRNAAGRHGRQARSFLKQRPKRHRRHNARRTRLGEEVVVHHEGGVCPWQRHRGPTRSRRSQGQPGP